MCNQLKQGPMNKMRVKVNLCKPKLTQYDPNNLNPT